MQVQPLALHKSPPSLFNFPKCCHLWSLQKIPLQILLFYQQQKLLSILFYLPSSWEFGLKSISWKASAENSKPEAHHWHEEGQPKQSYLGRVPSSQNQMSNPLTKKSFSLQAVAIQNQCHGGEETLEKKTQNNPQRLTVGIYLGWHQWDCLRGKETFCALNVYLLCSSSKLGVYPFKQRQEPIHLFLPDCPCFFWHAIPWKWLQWSAVGGPGGLLKQVEAFVSQGKRK